MINYKQHFVSIYNTIQKMGYKHTTDFFITADPENFYKNNIQRFIKKTLKDIKSADICIFEASIASLAVGFLIDYAIQYEKPVVVLYYKNENPFFLQNYKNSALSIYSYDEYNIKDVLKCALYDAKEKMEIRFTLLFSSKVMSYLNLISKKKKIPKSVYIRNLIDSDMEQNKFLD